MLSSFLKLFWSQIFVIHFEGESPQETHTLLRKEGTGKEENSPILLVLRLACNNK